jgi:hypothetical protein
MYVRMCIYVCQFVLANRFAELRPQTWPIVGSIFNVTVHELDRRDALLFLVAWTDMSSLLFEHWGRDGDYKLL